MPGQLAEFSQAHTYYERVENAMTITSKREVARILRAEAENIRRHGLTNAFNLSFGCLQAQVLRTEKCEGCLLGDYVRETYRREVFPCQFIEPEAWEQIADDAELVERIATRFVEIAGELEANAQAEEHAPVESSPQ